MLSPEEAGTLLKELLEFAQLPPLAAHQKKSTPLSAQFGWACGLLSSVLSVLLNKSTLSKQESNLAAEAAWLLGHARERHQLSGEDINDLDDSSFKHVEARRAYFWRIVEETRKETKEEPKVNWLLANPRAVLRLASPDFSWLLDDAGSRSQQNDQRLAFQLALEFWIASGHSRQDRRRILKVIGSQPLLLSAFHEFAAAHRFYRIKRFWWRYCHRIGNAMWWHVQISRLKHRYNSFRGQVTLLWHLGLLASGKPIDWLALLAREADPKNASQLAPTTWSGLEKKRGKLIARAVRRGCKAAWRRFVPELPHEADPSTIDRRIIVGLAGIQASLQDAEVNFSALTANEAEHAARYAVNELNGFPVWINELAAAHPSSVAKSLSVFVQY